MSSVDTSTISIIDTLRIFGTSIGLSGVDPRSIIVNLIRVAMGFIGIVLVLMILSSGVSFLFSGGDKEKISGAKKTLFNAIVGLAIILSAYSIIAFVMGMFETKI